MRRNKQVYSIDDRKIRLEQKLLFFPLFRLNTILVKNLETLVSVSPSQCWFGYHSGLSASKHPWLNIGEGEGTFPGGKQCEVEISGFFQKIREKRCLFQRFVTSIVGSVLDKFGGTEADIKRRLALARIAFTRLQNIWRSGRFSQKTKLRILNSNVLSVLLYGAEMWRVTTADLNKLDVFHRTCLRRVLRRFWPNHLSNEELYEATGSTPVSALVRVRRWRWIGRILRTSPSNISRTALTWAPEGKRRRSRPRETWRRTVEKERNQLGWHSWGAAVASAADREGWRNPLAGLKSPHGPDEDK